MSPRANLRDPQPMQISGEAQELTQMVNSWPTGGRSRCRKKEIAADLLRGALGLQESLVRLGEIEAACKFVSRRSREQSSRFTLGEELGVEMGGFRRFHAQGHQHGLRGVRNLRASRNCVEELKMVIGNSLRMQNLVSIAPTDGDDVDEKSSVTRTPKLPVVGDQGRKQRDEAESSGYAVAEQQKKARNPNLIARIMGLEEAPSEISVPVGGIERRRRRCSRKQRPLSDLEMLELPLTVMLQETGLFKGALKSAGLEVEKLAKDHNIEVGQASEQAKSQPPASELLEKMEKRAGKAVAEATEGAKSSKTKLPAASPDQKQLEKRASRTNGKNNGVQKAAADRDTSQEKKSMGSAAAQGSQPKKASRKPEKNSVQVKNRVPIQKNTFHHGDRRPDKPAHRNHRGSARGNKVMRAKPVEEAKPIITRKAEGSPSSNQEKRESIPTQEEGISPVSSTTSLCDLPLNGADHQCIAGERDVSALPGGAERSEAEPKLSSPIEDTRNYKPSFHCEVMPKRSHGRGIMGPRHAESTTPTPVAAAEALERIKSLLQSSPSFLHSTQELFNLPGHERPAGCRSTGSTETEKKKKKIADESKLLLDCAGELMSYRRRHLSELAHHPLCTICSKGGVTRISMNDLVEEIGTGDIQEELGCGGRAGADAASGDGLRAWANGAWGEQGWNEAMAPVEEGGGVACDMEKYVFEVLVEEITSDLLD